MYISTIDTVIRCDSDETLGAIMEHVTSSHSPVFVFSPEDAFLGIVSPYQILYSNKYPHSTKVSSIVKMPTHTTSHSPLYDVARSMLESRVYALPVFDDDKQVVGVIHLRDIYKELEENKDAFAQVGASLSPLKPVTAPQTATVGDIHQIMREKSVSRAILVDDQGKLAGIVSRKDLLGAFIKPTDKQRFGKNGDHQSKRTYDGEKKYRNDEPAKKYATEKVQTLPHATKGAAILTHLVSSPIHSIVLVDAHGKPSGFLSTHDILAGIALLCPQESINLIMSRPGSNVSEKDVQQAEKLLQTFGQKMHKRLAIQKIEVHSEESKFPSGGTAAFHISVVVTPVSGAKIISKTESDSFFKSIKEAIAQIEKQIRRNGYADHE